MAYHPSLPREGRGWVRASARQKTLSSFAAISADRGIEPRSALTHPYPLPWQGGAEKK